MAGTMRGVFPILITPFDEQSRVDEESLRSLVEFNVKAGIHGIGVALGSEVYKLSEAERALVTRVVVDQIHGRIPVVINTGAAGTDLAVLYSQTAQDNGADALMIMPPTFTPASPTEVREYFKAISDAVRHPILLYNIPRRVGFNLTPEVLEEMVGIEWVVAIKESSNDFIQVEATILAVGDQINVFTGHSAERGVPAVLMGARGFVSSMESQIMGREAVQMYDLVKRGEIDRARATQLRTLALDEQMRRLGTFPANLKAAMNLLGRRGGYPRRPLLPLTEPDLARVQDVLERLQITAPVA